MKTDHHGRGSWSDRVIGEKSRTLTHCMNNTDTAEVNGERPGFLTNSAKGTQRGKKKEALYEKTSPP